ncbi:hypothetical protein QQ045_010414 [Rhodiola kirilowii]
MMFYTQEISAFTHGRVTASRLIGSTPHDQLLIQISDSFSGLLLFAIGLLLLMAAFVKDRISWLFRQRLRRASRHDGGVESLFCEEAGGSCWGLA